MRHNTQVPRSSTPTPTALVHFLSSTAQALRKSISKDPFAVIAKKLSRLMLVDNFSNQQLATTVISLCKQVTGANWAEYFIVDGAALRVMTTLSGKQKEHRQKFTTVPIDEQSLAGLVATEGNSKTVSNAQTSSLYASFKYQFFSFSTQYMEPEDPQSLACVPFFDISGKVHSVVMLFDKVDECGSLSFFTDEDLALITNIGILLKAVIATRDKHAAMSKQLEKLNYFDSEKHHLNAVSLQLVRKHSLIDALKQILESTKVFTYEYLDLMTEVMESEGALLHVVSRDGILVPWIAFGIKLVSDSSEEVRALCTRTSEYLMAESEDVLIVRDYRKEKHLGSDTFVYWDKKFTTSISLPITEAGELMGVLEFYKCGDEFNFRDEHVGKLLVECISKIHPGRYYSHLPLSGRKDKEISRPYKKFGRASLTTVRLFSMRPEIFQFDFVGYLKQARSTIRELLKVDSCNLYIKDALTNSLWTWVSYNCQPLSIPISSYSLIGYSMMNEVVVNQKFPCGVEELDEISETGNLEGQSALAVPIFGNILKGQVLAVVILTRKEEIFSTEEANLIQRLAHSISMTLEFLFFSKYALASYDPKNHIPDSSSKPRQRERNLSQACQSPFTKAVSMDDIQYYSQVKQVRDTSEPESEIEEDSKSDLLKCYCQVAHISSARMAEVKEWLAQVDSKVDDVSLEMLYRALPTLIPCQTAKIFVYNETHQYLKDIDSPILSKASGLTKQAIQTRKPVLVNTSAHCHPKFSELLDSLSSVVPIETYLAVPVYYLHDEVIGVMVFVNSPTCFSAEDIAVARFLSLIPSKSALDADDALKKWNEVLKIGMRQQMLLSWCKQVMSVSAACQHNIISVKEVVHKLTDNSDFGMIVRALLEVIAINMNVEEVQVFIKHSEGHYLAFTKDEGVMLLQSGPELDIKKDALRSEQPKTLFESVCGKVNILIVQIRLRAEVIGGIELRNKRDATLSNYCSFTKEDEVIAQQYATHLGEPIHEWMREEKTDAKELQKVIRQAASTVNAYPLMSIIRKASQVLLNCDRSTIFIREKDNMVVLAQGTEQEIPVGFSVPVGVGIVGYVAKHCQTVNISDAYSDARFNPEVDKRTGYRTENMLCVPVFDSNHQVIAALQMINKHKGAFDDDDLTILDMFSDVISSALQIFDRFKSVVVQRSRLLHLLNSIGSYIVVINKEGKMEYCNQKFDFLFGVTEEIGRTKHFSYWLRENQDIIQDLQSVIDSPNTKVARQFQKLYPARHRRSSSMKSSTCSSAEDMLHVHYSVSPMLDFTTQECTGLIFVIEDVTQIVKLKKDMNMMKSKLREINATNAVQAQTGLNTCVSNLQTLKDNYSSMSTESAVEAIGKVISVLKSGNLERAHVVFDEEEHQLSEDMKTFINTEYLGRDVDCSPHIQFQTPIAYSPPLDLEASTNLSELRSWSLNIWDLGDLFPYIVCMLKDCNLLANFSIQATTLNSFLSEIKRLYDQRNNPFHNFYHGFNVMHSTYHLVTSTKAHTLFKSEDVFAILIAALCHDVDHTGRTNSFEVSKGSNLALLYHDTSVLEQHHAAIAFFTMQQESCNIFKSVPRDVYLVIRKIIISAILATDMSKHFTCIARMNERFQELLTSPLGSQENDKMSLIDLIVHCGDLAHPTKTFDLCLRWSLLVRQEFISQAKEEAALGLPVTQYMKDLENTQSYLNNEVSFNTFIVKPLWECLSNGLQPYVEQQMANLLDNIECYKEKLAEEQEQAQ